jgi:hypothetical protein
MTTEMEINIVRVQIAYIINHVLLMLDLISK